MTFATEGARPWRSRYADLDRCILLGPDAALISSRTTTPEEGSFACSTGSPPDEWLLELYGEDDETVRVLIAGEEE